MPPVEMQTAATAAFGWAGERSGQYFVSQHFTFARAFATRVMLDNSLRFGSRFGYQTGLGLYGAMQQGTLFGLGTVGNYTSSRLGSYFDTR